MHILYHASTNRDLEVIEPKRTLSHNKYIGDYVFATADKILATMYLATRGFATLMSTQNTQSNIVICADPGIYQEGDVGGAIYELSSLSFTESPQKDLNDYEFVSMQAVKPLSKVVFEKSLQAMSDAGIIIRFVDEQTFEHLLRSPHQTEMIKKLPIYK